MQARSQRGEGALATAETIVRLGLVPGPTEEEVKAEERAERARRQLVTMLGSLDLGAPLTEDVVDTLRRLRSERAGASHERRPAPQEARSVFVTEQILEEIEIESLVM